jgi:hypothetical protein
MPPFGASVDTQTRRCIVILRHYRWLIVTLTVVYRGARKRRRGFRRRAGTSALALAGDITVGRLNL